MTVIERQYGIPRSTLSNWFRSIELNEAQRTKLMKNSQDGWKKARTNAVKWHKAQKQLRLDTAKTEATKSLNKLPLTPEVLDIAFAMLYLGEGAKNNGSTSIANSDPMILNFVLDVLELNYGIKRLQVRCELHLRADQDAGESKAYWSDVLSVPIERFRGCYKDKRTANRPTYGSYKGVCVVYCGSIAIQRKITNMYNQFCERVAKLNSIDKGD